MLVGVTPQAVGGFAGPGYLYRNYDSRVSSFEGDVLVMNEDVAGTLVISGDFDRVDHLRLPASVALFLYIDHEDLRDDFARDQGEINSINGEFSATFTDVPNGFSNVILSFVVLDPAETPADQGPDSIFSVELVNNECRSPLTISLTWSTDSTDLDLYVTEPGGTTVSFQNRLGVSQTRQL